MSLTTKEIFTSTITFTTLTTKVTSMNITNRLYTNTIFTVDETITLFLLMSTEGTPIISIAKSCVTTFIATKMKFFII